MIDRSERGETAISIVTSLQVGKTQIQNIIKDKDSIKARWEAAESRDRKLTKIRKTKVSTPTSMRKFGSGFVKPEEEIFP